MEVKGINHSDELAPRQTRTDCDPPHSPSTGQIGYNGQKECAVAQMFPAGDGVAGMAEKSAESAVGKYLGAPIGGALTALITWATAGSTGAISPALVSLLAVLGGLSGLALTLLYRRYLAILGANRRVAAERQAYIAVRDSLAEGNLAARLYSDRLTRFLDWIDRFFGDAGMADRTLFPHAFGLRTPAPLWTAPALDRCLLLALLYPIAAIFIFWAISGQVGPAEQALHLQPAVTGWQRIAAGAGFGSLVFFLSRGNPLASKAPLWRRLTLNVAAFLPFVLGVGFTGSTVMVTAFAALFIAGGFSSSAFGSISVSFVTYFCFLSAISFQKSIVGVLGLIVLFVALIFVSLLSKKAQEHQWQGAFLSSFLAGMTIISLGAAYFMSSTAAWERVGPMLLFLGLLTVVNAPFDWASLGLTRSLLRRGLELGGWWPYGLALVDAALAAVVIAALALTMVVGVQAFNALAAYGGGAPVLALDQLFEGIAGHPTVPEYWWLYALLLSTMIPSLLNLVIGGTSLVRGVPGVPSLLLRFMPERSTVPRFERAWIATVLTAQVAAGAALGIAAQIFLVWVIIGYVMPWFGADLLDMARDVAAFNLPARVGHLFGVSL